MDRPYHAIIASTVYPTGAELYTCPDCAYQFVYYNGRRIPLDNGDTDAIHSGGYLEMGAPKVVQDDEPLPREFQEWEDNLP